MNATARALISALKADCHRAAARFITRELGPHEPLPITAMLRRRREAALRLPPLPDGRHDPMEPR